MKCDINIRKDLCSNMVLSGGATMYLGITDGAEDHCPGAQHDEDQDHGPTRAQVLGVDGGSILASLSTFQQVWISKQEYDKSGPFVVHRKCF